jgi:hypothetical protein
MRSASRTRSALVIGFLACSALTGCAEPVREDRTITWSADGQGVGFQHGRDGVFIADKEGGGLKKIFHPDDDVLAVSTPLWAPDGKRLIFATARAPQGWPAPAPARDQEPAGNVHLQQPVVYSCWLRDEEKAGAAPEPAKLFDAECDHGGYVAANLAVRWHPGGGALLYVQRVGDQRHGLFEYNLRTGKSRRAFTRDAEALLFDWAPDGVHLACVLGNAQGPHADDGIWIGRPGGDDWWHVPGSAALAAGELPSLLEDLRATRPAFTADTAHFAFVSSTLGKTDKEPARHALRVGALADRTVETWFAGTEPLRDLHWAPDGSRLGLIRGGGSPSLHLVRRGEPLSEAISRSPVRQFPGWNSAGDRLAYVVREEAPATDGASWAFLFLPDPQGRDGVLLADGSGSAPGRDVFSGMRVTFPQWAPTEGKLSVWFTYRPRYESWPSWILTWISRFPQAGPSTAGQPSRPATRPWWRLWGDPAAVLDAKTGDISWLAVDPHEKVQVGHYYVLKHDYTHALHWYAEAEKQQPRAAALKAEEALERLADPDGTCLFQSYCLTKLGRTDEARAKLEQFRRDFPPAVAPEPAEPAGQHQLREVLAPGSLSAHLLRDQYIAEFFLGVDADLDGREFFRAAAAEAESDQARLSSTLMLAQMLLVGKRYSEYAELATDTLMPLLLKVWEPRPADKLGVTDNAFPDVLLPAGLTLLPLYSPEFLSGLSDDQVRALAPRWEKLRPQARDDATRLGIDLFLENAARRLKDEARRQQAALRIEKNPARGQLLPAGGVPELIESLRQLPGQLEALRKLLTEF